jgi:hypothetical protein
MGELVVIVGAGGAALCAMRAVLMARPLAPERLDDPAKHGFPMAGMLSAASASAAINRSKPAARPWWKFGQ